MDSHLNSLFPHKHVVLINVIPNSNAPVRIEGFCDIPGWVGEMSVITFSKVNGKWSLASSIALPSNIVRALAIKQCFDAAFAELDKQLEPQIG